MKHEEYFEDDRCIIPAYIEKMSDKELDAFIAEREAVAAKQKALKTIKSTPTMRTSA